jgi:hypothetical protein
MSVQGRDTLCRHFVVFCVRFLQASGNGQTFLLAFDPARQGLAPIGRPASSTAPARASTTHSRSSGVAIASPHLM